MTSPLAFQRAHFLAKGVRYETDGLEERLLTDYFTTERLLRFYEHRMIILAIRSITAPESMQSFARINETYMQMLFPEKISRRESFVKRGTRLLKSYEGKLFALGGEETGLKFHGLTEQSILDKKLADLHKRLEDLDNANS